MKKILLGSVATGALVAAGSASAADLGPRPAYKAPPMVAPVPAFSWTGCFVGAHGGWGWSKKDVTERLTFSTSAARSRSGTIDTSGAIFGGQIGCDYQFASNFVIGIQGDFAGATLKSDTVKNFIDIGSTTNNLHVQTDWLSSVTGRVGITGWIPRTMLYARGGGAWIRERWDFLLQDFSVGGLGGSGNHSFSQTRSGWTIGGGIEYAIAPNWSIFAEFNFYDFGTKRAHLPSTSGLNFTRAFDIDAKQRLEAVRVGVNYRFNWGKGKAPVVAKY
jgi:outer membrane immunogenic protein